MKSKRMSSRRMSSRMSRRRRSRSRRRSRAEEKYIAGEELGRPWDQGGRGAHGVGKGVERARKQQTSAWNHCTAAPLRVITSQQGKISLITCELCYKISRRHQDLDAPLQPPRSNLFHGPLVHGLR